MKTTFPLAELHKELNVRVYDKDDGYYLGELAKDKRFLVIADAGGAMSNPKRRYITVTGSYQSAWNTFHGWMREKPAIVYVSPENVCQVLDCSFTKTEEERLGTLRNILALADAGLTPHMVGVTLQRLRDEVNPPPATVLLLGPCLGCGDLGGLYWREEAKKVLPKTIDPTERAELVALGEERAKQIVAADKLDIEKAGVLLVNYTAPVAGLDALVCYARSNSYNKPIYVVAEYGIEVSPWVRVSTTTVFNTFKEAFEACSKVTIQPRGW